MSVPKKFRVEWTFELMAVKRGRGQSYRGRVSGMTQADLDQFLEDFLEGLGPREAVDQQRRDRY